MYFNTINHEQLDALPTPEMKWRLDHLLRAHQDPRTGKITRGSETINACWEEDRRRAHALRRKRSVKDACRRSSVSAMMRHGGDSKGSVRYRAGGR